MKRVTTHDPVPSPPINKGKLLFPSDIRREVFREQVSEWWVRKNVAPEKKIRLGHSTVAWWEADVIAWINSRQEVL